MTRASINNKKMTNVQLSNGDHVMGIRKNPEDDTFGDQKLAGDAMEMPIGRPLRYTPGLKCDAHLESLRPERAGNHRAIQVTYLLHTGCNKKMDPSLTNSAPFSLFSWHFSIV